MPCRIVNIRRDCDSVVMSRISGRGERDQNLLLAPSTLNNTEKEEEGKCCFI